MQKYHDAMVPASEMLYKQHLEEYISTVQRTVVLICQTAQSIKRTLAMGNIKRQNIIDFFVFIDVSGVVY